MASHDLQAPLATIAGYGDLLSAEYADALDERGRDWLERVHLASERMSELVSSLLVLARSGHQATRRPVSTRALVEDVRVDLGGLLEQAGAVVELEDGAADVVGDGPGLRQVLQNLVQNAVKYRHPDRTPHVLVRVVARPDDWMVTVEDNGAGIAVGQREQVFAMFQRASGTTGGHGIGLATCRRTVERHGGRIWVEDTASGEGSRFCFTLARDGMAPGVHAA
ncbi:hypothetical protein GCM10027596_11420 [Nocardioides korecus]